MAVHDQDMSSGKNGVNKAINAGRSAGKLLFSKGTSSLLLSGQTVGIAGFFGVIIILLVFMIMTMPMSTLTSTKESYDKAANFMEDQLYHAYDEAARQVATQIKDSASAPFDDGGYNCGNVIVEFGYFEFTAGADFLNTGVTHEPNYRDENENYTYIRTDGEKIEVDEEGERPSDEERDSHRSACTIKVNFYPTLTQESGIIGAYVEAANGTINNMPEEAYEEGYVTDDIIAAMKTENANAEDLQNENDIFESEEKYESFMSKYGTKYNSISSDEFQRDFEAFVKRGTAKYFYKGQRKTESYEARTNPIFYALYNHKMFENEDAEESIISTTEEIKDQTQVCFSGHVDTDTGRCETNFIYGAASNDSAIDCVNRGECEFSYKYKYYSTFLYEMEITVPILYDISGYRQREFDNLYEAFKNAGMDPDFYGEYVQDALNANYQHTLEIRGLKDEEERYRELADEAIRKFLETVDDGEIYVGFNNSGYNIGGAFTGTPYNYYGLTPGGYGDTAYMYGDDVWSMQSSCPSFYSFAADCIGAGSNGRTQAAKNRMDLLAKNGILNINFNYSCVEFAMMWCYDHYGVNYIAGMGNGNAVVENLVNKHGDVFVETAGPYPGSIISITGGPKTSNHIACVDRIWEENGQTMLEVSDGNVNGGTAVRIRAVVSLSELEANWKMRFASPRSAVPSD